MWESATFDSTTVRLSAQRHGIRTDASTRYEKSLDPLLPGFSLSRIFDYLDFLGKKYDTLSSFSYVDAQSVRNIEISVSHDFLTKKIGMQIATDTVYAILGRLGFDIIAKNDDIFTVRVPSWRSTKDINIPEDIVEEVGRVYGYDHVPLDPLDAKLDINTKNYELLLRESTLLFFRDTEWNEVYNYSFTNAKLDEALGYSGMESAVGIQNAFNESYTHMRRSLATHLFENIRDNLKYSKKLRFFELGKVYNKDIPPSAILAPLLGNLEKKPFSEQKVLA